MIRCLFVLALLLLFETDVVRCQFGKHIDGRKRIAVRLNTKDNEFANELAAQHGYENLGQVGMLESYFVFQELPVNLRRRDVRDTPVGEHDAVEWWQEQRARQLVKRDVVVEPQHQHIHHHVKDKEAYVVEDPGFPRQWHLHGSPMSVNVQPVWDSGIFGKGVLVSIIDDGLEYDHPDLAANWRADASYDFNDDDPDVIPNPTIDDHGTSAAGACCGVNVNVCKSIFNFRRIVRAYKSRFVVCVTFFVCLRRIC
jgi:subtilisin family serine protease